jgi:hypothetical protein
MDTCDLKNAWGAIQDFKLSSIPAKKRSSKSASHVAKPPVGPSRRARGTKTSSPTLGLGLACVSG